jgi:hypothetical protein
VGAGLDQELADEHHRARIGVDGFEVSGINWDVTAGWRCGP